MAESLQFNVLLPDPTSTAQMLLHFCWNCSWPMLLFGVRVQRGCKEWGFDKLTSCVRKSNGAAVNPAKPCHPSSYRSLFGHFCFVPELLIASLLLVAMPFVPEKLLVTSSKARSSVRSVLALIFVWAMQFVPDVALRLSPRSPRSIDGSVTGVSRHPDVSTGRQWDRRLQCPSGVL